MSRVDRPLDNPINWSFRLGRLKGTEVHVHLAFLVAFVLLVWVEFPTPGEIDPRSQGAMVRDALGTFAILIALVLMHELGHWLALRAFGGRADRLLLWPLGGPNGRPIRPTPASAFAVAAGGPMMNVAVCAVASAAIILWLGSLAAVPWNPLYPMSPVGAGVLPTRAQDWLMRTFGVSYMLLMVNLLPMYPFDGGRMLQAWLWNRRSAREATMAAAGTGMVTALVLGLTGLFHEHGLLLILLAVLGYLTCWQVRRAAREGELTPDGAVDEMRLPWPTEAKDGRRGRGIVADFRARRAAKRIENARKAHAERLLAVDHILRKVARHGLSSLNRRERRILAAETRRQREIAN